MSNNLWVAYTPGWPPQFFPTEADAMESLRQNLQDEGEWLEDAIPGSWVGKITKRPKLRIVNQCTSPGRKCAYRNDDVCRYIEVDRARYRKCFNPPHPHQWVYTKVDGVEHIAELEFVDAEEEK